MLLGWGRLRPSTSNGTARRRKKKLDPVPQFKATAKLGEILAQLPGSLVDPCCPAQPPTVRRHAAYGWNAWYQGLENTPLLVESAGSESLRVVANIRGQISLWVCTCICHRRAYASLHRG